MFKIIIYHKQTRKIIAALPFVFTNKAGIYLGDSIMYEGYDFAIYSETEPILYEDKDGDLCLRENCFVMHSSILEE